MSTKRPFTIRIHAPHGEPDGLKIIEKINWTGSGIICPRSLLNLVKGRDEFGKTGVYILIGPSDNSDLVTAYIGEGDPVRPRLEQHNANKDFWNTAIIFTSKDMNLNKAHVQHIESRLIDLANSAKRCDLENVQSPNLPSLSEADKADVETFIEEMLICFPVLGIDIFKKPEKVQKAKEDSAVKGAILTQEHEFSSKKISVNAPIPNEEPDMLFIKNRNIEANGYESNRGFIVLKGSQAERDSKDSMQINVKRIKENLVSKRVLLEENGVYVFTQDYEFSSPSQAGCLVLASSVNGRIVWKDKTGKTLREIQEANI